ncbi:hypothetical protein [Paraburkholderia ferrariae]|jgi:hypothetical protein|uniref:hypothetical protein n=1 Tax=Paraburkholderia ferrariae TaxID=386056 RepID=UPI0004874BF2|nr:hypothetical protein [Paraburkholderia ferrariae]
MNIDIHIKYTERAIAAAGQLPSRRFSYSTGVPFPQPGDLIETEVNAETVAFKVVERVFSFEHHSLDIRLLLDLPS